MSERKFGDRARLAARVAGDTLLAATGRYSQYVITLITVPLLARVLGLHELGVLALGSAAYFFGSAFGDLGLTQAAAAAASGSEVRPIGRRHFLLLRLALCGVTALAYALVSATASRSASIIALGFLVGAVSSLSEDWLLIATGKFGQLATAQVAGRIGYLAALIGLLSWQQTAEIGLLALGMGAVVTIVVTHTMVRNQRRLESPGAASKNPTSREGWRYVRTTVPDIAGQRFLSLTYNQGVALFLGPAVSPTALGIFSAADRLIRAIQGLLDAMGVAIVTRMAKQRHRTSVFNATAARVIRIAGLLGAACTVILLVGADALIWLLYGPEFEASAGVLRLESALLAPVAVATVATTAIMYVRGDTRGPLIATLIGIAGAIVFVPVVLQTGSPYALAGSAVISECCVAGYLVWRHLRAQRGASVEADTLMSRETA